LEAKGSFSLLVQPEHLADRFKDAILPPVLATPVMIMVMENAALNAIRAYLDPGDVRHLAATSVGRRVTGEAEVTKVDGGKSSSPSEQPRTRRSGPARIPGSSSTWPNSRGGSNEQRLAQLQRPFRAAGKFGPRWTSSRPGDTLVRLSLPSSIWRLEGGAEETASGHRLRLPETALTRNSVPIARGRSPARGGGPLGCRRHRGRQQIYLVVRHFPRHPHHGFWALAHSQAEDARDLVYRT
jgi:hypothetical protein